MHVCVQVRGAVHMNAQRPEESAKSLKFYVAMSPLLWVLGPEPVPLGRAESDVNCWAISQTPKIYIIYFVT